MISAGTPVQFTDTTTGVDPISRITHLWEFGDGATSAAAAPVHTYAAAGDYTVRLTLTDQWNRASFHEEEITVVPPAAVADFAIPSGTLRVGDSIAFTDASTVPAGLVVTRAWDFEDNGSVDSTATSPSHAYGSAGTYTARLTLTDQYGRTSTATESVVISPLAGIARASTGLLFRDDFNRANGPLGSDYTVAAGTWSVSSNVAECAGSATGNHDRAIVSAIAARATMVVQCQVVWSTTDGVGANLLVKWDEAGDAGYLLSCNSYQLDIYRRTAGTWTTLGTLVQARTAGTTYTLKGLATASQQVFWVDGVQRIATSDATHNALSGRAAMRSFTNAVGKWSRYDNLVICSSNTVSISGLPAGYKLRVNGTTVLRDVAGNASVDCAGATFPLTQAEVLDASNAVVHTFAPADGVWGGDVLTYTP